MRTWFIIPARKGSKRFPFKNRKLVPICLSKLKNEWIQKTIISTNDSAITEIAKKFGTILHMRSESNSSDEASMKETLKEVIRDIEIPREDRIICLYPTYPERTTSDIIKAINFFNESNSSSMLCKKDIKSHPYICLRDLGENKGELLVDHSLYRWQDFPKCFEYSHFIIMFKVGEIENLNFQLFNEDTVYFKINDVVDVDDINDFKKFSLSRIN